VDSEAASSTFTVVLLQDGDRVGHRPCKALQKHGARPRHSRSCLREATIGNFTHADTAGRDSFMFSGRVKGHALGAGSDRLLAQPRLGTLLGPAVDVGFRIV
jgi:hypothetical protein